MTIRLKIILLLLASIFFVVCGISAAVWTTSLKYAEVQFVSNSQAQLDRVEELITSFVHTGEQVAKSLAEVPEGKKAAGALTNYTGSTEATAMDRTKFSPVEADVS